MSLFCPNPPILSLKILPISSFPKNLISRNVNSSKFASGFHGKSVSAIPSFLTPSLIPQRLHCSTSTIDEEDESDSMIVFVKGLPLATSEGLLKKAFSEFGEVHRVKIITDKKNKQPLGFAYIWFKEQESAQKAVKEMNGEFFDGRFIMVTIARPGSCKTPVKTTPYKF